MGASHQHEAVPIYKPAKSIQVGRTGQSSTERMPNGGRPCSEEEGKRKDYQVVVTEECVWALDEEETGGPTGTEPCKVL